MNQSVLFVDDNLSILQGLLRKLRKEPYHLRTATSGYEALQIMEQSKIDLIVSDWHMPAMTGGELLATVAKMYPECVRILLTGQPSLAAAMNAINSGEVYRFLTKPYDADALGSLIRNALEQRAGKHAAVHPETQSSPSASSQGNGTEIRAVKAALIHMEERLRDAQKFEALGRLAGGICHDFNNLLTVINGYSDLLLAKAGEGEFLQESLEQIRGAGERAAGLASQILFLSRKSGLSLSNEDLNAIVREFVSILSRLVGEQIELVTAVSAEPLIIRADRRQVEQLIMNLVVNARDSIRVPGRLVIETSTISASGQSSTEPSTWALLSVSDTGAGMDEYTQTRIFEPFFTTKGEGKGTGLGLTTVREIVSNMKGRIEVHSELGLGTVFKIYLPCTDASCPAALVNEDLAYRPRGAETVLVVEDDDNVRVLVQVILEDLGYAVLSARNGAEALSLWDRQHAPIDLLLTDVAMPRVGGLDLAETLVQRCNTLKVLYMSGYADSCSDFLKNQKKDIHLLHKPFTSVTLARQVREMLDRECQVETVQMAN